jgi:diadenylate cyclase
MLPFVLPALPRLTITSVIDVVAVAIIIYQFLLMIRGRRSAHIVTGLGAVILIYAVSIWAQLDLLRSLLEWLAPYSALAVVVMFQSEIRRLLARLGRGRWLGLGGQLERREVAEEIVLAVRQMASVKCGALIVCERDIGLRTFVESGVALDALISSDLLSSIFLRGGSLHDGAVVIQGDRVAAAACFLPLSTNPVILQRVGTRHRAAIGVTEETDALAVVVSEETGQIAIAYRGELEMDVTAERLQERLTQHVTGRVGKTPTAPEPQWKQAGL